MKRMAILLGTFLLGCAAVYAADPASPARAPRPDVAKATINDLAWFAGHWEGQSGETRLEQFCSAPAKRMLMCMVRFIDPQQVSGLEFVTLEEKAEGVEERIRFFGPSLEEKAGAGPVMLRLAKLSDSELVFENPDTGKTGPRRVTLTRSGSDEIGVHIEITNDKNETQFIDAHWRRAK
jgi:uncharacterized protein DUF6265